MESAESAIRDASHSNARGRKLQPLLQQQQRLEQQLQQQRSSGVWHLIQVSRSTSHAFASAPHLSMHHHHLRRKHAAPFQPMCRHFSTKRTSVALLFSLRKRMDPLRLLLRLRLLRLLLRAPQ